MFVELFVTDVERAAQFFEKGLGFKRTIEHKEPEGLDFAIVENGALEVNLHWMLRKPEQQNLEKTIRLYFEPEDDLAALHLHLQKSGYSPRPIEDSGYGADVFHLIGPDGYEFWFHQWRK
jgi:uncharacterized glyoxalase superfamily protein PhnB